MNNLIYRLLALMYKKFMSKDRPKLFYRNKGLFS